MEPESSTINANRGLMVEDTDRHVEELAQKGELNHDLEEASEADTESMIDKQLKDKSVTGKIDVSIEVKHHDQQLSKSATGAAGDASLSEKLSKAVVIGDAEEGELDYEEEVPEEEQHLQHERERSYVEEGEVMEEKEGANEQEEEGSEEGEIISDAETGDKVTKEKEDKEEGEVKEDDLEEGQLDEELDKGPRPRVLCKYYEAGTCRWGITCRFLHPGINDKGNYVMHRPVGMYPTAFGKPPPPSELGPLNNMVQRGPPIPVMQPTGFGDNAHIPVELEMLLPTQPRKESAWERGLKKAKEIKLTSIKRKEEDENFEEKRMNLSIKENEAETERPAVVRREQWRHAMERDGQTGTRPRPVDLRPELNERRFNRNRKSPLRRYEGDRDRGNRPYEQDREKVRDMDRERYLRMRRERTPPSQERRGRERERERDKQDPRRNKRNDAREKIPRAPPEETHVEPQEKTEQNQDEGKQVPAEEISQSTEVPPVSPKMNAEQWVDPWMRRQPQPNRSPEIKSPAQGDDLSSIGSSDSEDDSDSEESDESGSESDSDSGESSNAERKNKPEKVVADAKAVAAPEQTGDAVSTAGPRDPRIATPAANNNAGKPDSLNDRNRPPNKPSRSGRDYGDANGKKHLDPSRRLHRRDGEGDRRDRGRRDRYPPSAAPWPAQSPMEGEWPRMGFGQQPGGGYRGEDRVRRPDEDPRFKPDRYRGSRRPLARSPRDSPHSRRRDPREGPKDDADRRRPEGFQTQSPKQRDPRLADAERQRKREEERRAKEENPADKKTSIENAKRPDSQVPATVDEPAGNKDEKTSKNNAADLSDDEFRSPKYKAGSGTGSESESESGSESESESEAASDSDSGSASATPSEKSGTESEGGSESGSDHSNSSDSDGSTSRKKEIEKKKKDFEAVLSQTKSLSSSQRSSKPKPGLASRDQTDQQPQAGQKRPGSGDGSSVTSPKAAPSTTSARKDELLKELRAIEDAIARKRAKIE